MIITKVWPLAHLFATVIPMQSTPPVPATAALSTPNHARVGELYSQHHGWLHAWLCKKLGCSHRAADLAQDTFLRLFSLSSTTTLLEPRGFLTTTATRLIIDQARRKKIERHYIENYHFYHGAEQVAPSTEELIIIGETLMAIVKMLEALPQKCQRAFLMSKFDGMRYADIATELGVSKSMVQQYITRVTLAYYKLTYEPPALPSTAVSPSTP